MTVSDCYNVHGARAVRPTPTGLQRTICFPFIRPTQWPVITYYWAYSIDEWVFLDLCRTAHRRITSKSPAENNNRYVYGRKFTTFSDFSSSNNNNTVVRTSNFAQRGAQPLLIPLSCMLNMEGTKAFVPCSWINKKLQNSLENIFRQRVWAYGSADPLRVASRVGCSDMQHNHRATLCVSAVFVVRRCPSVCPSVTFVYCIQTTEHVVELLSWP